VIQIDDIDLLGVENLVGVYYGALGKWAAAHRRTED
jgi:hypothetical protein